MAKKKWDHIERKVKKRLQIRSNLEELIFVEGTIPENQEKYPGIKGPNMLHSLEIGIKPMHTFDTARTNVHTPQINEVVELVATLPKC